KKKRELYYRLNKETPKEERFPYHKRWTRNATAVHEAIQRDMLYAEVLVPGAKFKVARKNGLPAWEENVKHPVIVEHNGKEFAVLGMMDGILEYKDGSTIGFEIKTKSTTIASVGNYLLKKPADSHLTQATAYSILFGIDEYLFLYESLAKDGWTKGAEAKPDIRVFYHKVTEEDRLALLDKFSEVVSAVETGTIPEMETDKCLFCQYKHLCQEVG
ncbi:MAG: PD-(D/E)XK nuclease family protein, partial [Erysipelotrichaceae bacterium]|nr:PD-(D/E)XK nuclease family protein [Erysipelotrichaceae bacterium]